MPELPEVETVRRDLEELLVGRRIEAFEITGHRTIRRQERSRVIDAVQGEEIVSLRRRGKFLLVDLTAEVTLVVHLRMSGQLLWRADPGSERVPHTHAVLAFADGRLDFVDPRTFGEMWATSPDIPELWHLGPDALTQDPDFARLLRRRGSMKALLMNQTFVAGIGNIYSDEILWTARVRPDRVPMSLTSDEVDAVGKATHSLLATAIAERGSTLGDQQYVDVSGRPGRYQRHHRVYARAGQRCSRCGEEIERVRFGNRSAFCCPACQG